MGEKRLTKDQRELLAPFVQKLIELRELILAVPEDEFGPLAKAAATCTQTNCSYMQYEIATLIKDEARRRQTLAEESSHA